MRKARRIIAPVLGMLVSTVTGPASATIVTFGFEGPVVTWPRSLGTYVRGQITYDTNTPAQSEAGRLDRGDVLRYDAVHRKSFEDVRLWARSGSGTITCRASPFKARPTPKSSGPYGERADLQHEATFSRDLRADVDAELLGMSRWPGQE